MTLIIVLSTIVFFLIGYYIMNNIDKFMFNNIKPTNDSLVGLGIINNYEESNDILIFGESEIANRIKEYCESKDYNFKVILDINNIDNRKYLYLLALSNNDADNLIISSVGLKVYSIPHIFTLCNSQDNLKLYNEFNFEKVILYDDDIDKMYNYVRGMMENAIKNQA